MNRFKLAEKLRKTADDLETVDVPPRQDIQLWMTARDNEVTLAQHVVNVPALPDHRGVVWEFTLPVEYVTKHADGEHIIAPVTIYVAARAAFSRRTE